MIQALPRYRWAALVTLIPGISLSAAAASAQPTLDFQLATDSGESGLVVTGTGYDPDPDANWIWLTVDDVTAGGPHVADGPAFAAESDGSFRHVVAFDVQCGHEYKVEAYQGESPSPVLASASKQVQCGQSPEQSGENASGKWVTGYYAVYDRDSLPPEEIDWTGLTHIVVTKLSADVDDPATPEDEVGGVTVAVNGAATEQDAQRVRDIVRQVATVAHTNDKKAIKALLMLGGEATGPAIRAATDAAHRAKFVDNLIARVNEYGYDGIDLDWEDNIDYDQFVALARELRAKQPSWIITAPGLAINANFPDDNFDARLVELATYLDQFNLMTYYPATAYAGQGWDSWFNSPLSGAKHEDGQFFGTPVSIDFSLARHTKINRNDATETGIPRAKLGMGMSFYAICYSGDITGPRQSTDAPGVQILGGDNHFPLSRLWGPSGPRIDATTRQWDAVAQVPYLSLPVADAYAIDGGTCRYVSYDDEESIKAKGKFTRDNGYGGAAVWTINQGNLGDSDRPANSLFQALKQGFLDP